VSDAEPDDAEPDAPPARPVSSSAREAGLRSTPPAKRGVIATLVAVGCAYELVAEGINAILDEPVMPSATTGIQAFRGRAVAAKLAPRSARVGAMLGSGYVIGVVVAAVAARKATK
jgi:hypothetical protein